MKTKFLQFVVVWVSVVILGSCTEEKKTPGEFPPNIILILADDMGYDDLGIHGNQLLETPHLDQLAGESVQFTQFYVTPVCATTRASLLTGRHFLRTGVSHVHGGKDFLHLDETTVAEKLKEAGYRTGMWGKWHSGKTPGYFPWERGFDEAYMARLYVHKNNEGLLNGVKVQTKGWLTEVLTDYAIKFIQENRDRPFFAYLPYLSCHAPLKAPESHVQKYLDKGLSQNLSTLYGMVDHMDFQIGRLLATIEDLDLEKNTLVIFMSDNGPAIINNLLTDKDRRIRYVNQLRGHKGNIWENGVKSPLFVRWRDHLDPGKVEVLSDVTDIYPSLLELAGVSTSPDQMPLDGSSLLPYMEDRDATLREKKVFFYANPGWPPTDKPWTPEGVKDEYRPWKFAGGDYLSYETQIIGLRGERYKLLMNPGPSDGTIRPDSAGFVLVDIREDPGERENLVDAEREVFIHMRDELYSMYESVYGETHAFEMPLFRISSDTLLESRVLAYGPELLSRNPKNASGYLGNMNRAGDSAVYAAEVLDAGIYDVELRYIPDKEAEHTFRFSFSDQEYIFKAPVNANRIPMGRLKFPEGKIQLVLQNLRDQPGSELKIHEIAFHYIKQTD